VTPGRLDIPGVRTSGISATVGLVAVVTVLLVAGVLVLSGDSLLSRGGMFGGGPAAAGSPNAGEAAGTPAPGTPGPPATPASPEGAESVYSCEPISIRDPERSRWRLANVEAAAGEGFEQVRLSLQRTGRRGEGGTVTAEWLSPDVAVQTLQVPRPAGTRALVLRFENAVELDSDRSFDADTLDDLGVRNLRSIQVSSGPDGRTTAVIGVAGDGCARLSAPRWERRRPPDSADVLLDVEAP
jgi:hypothetical protein